MDPARDEVRVSGPLRVFGLLLLVGLLLGGLSAGFGFPGTRAPRADLSGFVRSEAGANGSTYPVNFTESAVPAGFTWSVTVAGKTWSTTNSSLHLLELNGSYNFSAYSAALKAEGYSGGGFDNGSFVVSGNPVQVALWTSPFPAPGAESAAAGSPLTPASAFAGAAVIAALLGLLAVALHARFRKPPSIPPPAPGPKSAGPAGGAGPGPTDASTLDSDPLRHML